jgi:hypothetical protein
VNREELLGPKHAQSLEDLGANLVLPTIAARGAHERRPHPAAVTHHRQQRVVLVVWMRGRFHERAGRGELAQHQPQCSVIREFPDWLDA